MDPDSQGASRLADVAWIVATVPLEVARDVVRTAREMPLEVLRGLRNAGREPDAGGWIGSLHRLARTGLGVAGRAAGTVLDGGVRILQGATDLVAVSTFLQPPSRHPTVEERAFLRSILGDALDVERLRLQRRSVTERLGLAPHAVGHTLYLNQSAGEPALFDPEDGLTTTGLRILAHEAAHAWQDRNGRGYIHRALLAQYVAWRRTGTRGSAYEWRRFAAAEVAFEDLNPEAQAQLLEDVARFVLASGSTDPREWHTGLDDWELSYLLDGWKRVRAGRSAARTTTDPAQSSRKASG